MTTSALTRWIAPGLLAAGLSAAAFAPAPAHAQSNDDLVQVIVDVADVVLRGNQPYYRGNYDDRLRVSYDHRGRPTYYRTSPRHHDNRYNAHYNSRHYRDRHNRGYVRDRDCDRRGRCTVKYYDPRQDRSHDRRWR